MFFVQPCITAQNLEEKPDETACGTVIRTVVQKMLGCITKWETHDTPYHSSSMFFLMRLYTLRFASGLTLVPCGFTSARLAYQQGIVIATCQDSQWTCRGWSSDQKWSVFWMFLWIRSLNLRNRSDRSLDVSSTNLQRTFQNLLSVECTASNCFECLSVSRCPSLRWESHP